MTPTETDLSAILAAHAEWRRTGGQSGTRANLSEADLSGANLSEADLSGANLIEADLSGADLSGANFYEASLDWANLYEADLAEANLAEANLARANLAGASLAEANFYRADLAGANLYGANLIEADLAGASLYGAKGIATAGPVGSSGRMIYAVDHGHRIMVLAGCWWGSADDLRARIAPGGEHGWADNNEARNRADYTAALAWLTHRIESGRAA